MDPDQIAVLDILDDGLCKETVDFLVGNPSGFVECDFTGVVVEKRPKDGIYYFQLMALGLSCGGVTYWQIRYSDGRRAHRQ